MRNFTSVLFLLTFPFFTHATAIPAGLDADAALITINNLSFFTKETRVSCTLKNQGNETIKQVVIKWSIDNGTAASFTFSGLAIPPTARFDLKSPLPIVASIGPHLLTVWIHSVNDSADSDQSNDTLTKLIQSVDDSFPPLKPLYEEFTGNYCFPCAEYSRVFIPWSDAVKDSITLLKYMLPLPKTGSESETRSTYYQVPGIPDLFANGRQTITMEPPPYISFANIKYARDAFAESYAARAPIHISGSHRFQSTVIHLNDTIYPLMDIPDVNIYAVVFEKETTQNTGSNGEPAFHHVVMKMIPDASGIHTSLSTNTPFILNQSLDLSGLPIEEYSDLGLVIFVQDSATKEILQSSYSTNSTSVGIVEKSDKQIKVFPNPSPGIFHIPHAPGAKITIFSATGILVQKFEDLPTDLLNLENLGNGFYHLLIEQPDASRLRGKLLIHR